jgi:hypothetical protein
MKSHTSVTRVINKNDLALGGQNKDELNFLLFLFDEWLRDEFDGHGGFECVRA